MKQKKDQFVIACLESPATADTVLPVARHCAAQLGKGIILLNVSRDGDNEWLKQYGLPYVGLKGDWKVAIDGLPMAFGGVLAVTALDPDAPRTSIANPSTLLRTFADCRIAYLCVPAASANNTLASAYLTLDHRRESKEKLIWGSYMVRFFGSRLMVALPDYRDSGLRERQWANLQFLKKMYASLNVDYTTVSIEASNFTSPDLTLARDTSRLSADTSLLIAMTTDMRDRDLGDLLTGTPERRLLQQTTVPVLLLNQRDDLYVLCD